jgi:hypothetical protein
MCDLALKGMISFALTWSVVNPSMKVMRIHQALLLVILAAAAAVGCGGNPAGPDSGPGIVVRGSVQGTGTLRAASGASSATTVTVSVAENPSLKTTVGGDGSFTLRGLPAGEFTLVFSNGAIELGRLSFSEVRANQEITLTVQVSDSGIVLVEEQRNGIGHGDVEIEGTVSQVVALVASGDSTFVINGRTVIARPGETAVREGNRSRNIEDITEGRRVHVKGVWMTPQGAPAGTTQPVLAQEIKLQGDQGQDENNNGDEGTPAPPKSACAIGAKVEVEGTISGTSGSTISVNQQGKGTFACQVSGGTRIRKGNTSYTLAQLQVGWRVHVSGSGLGESGGTCRVAADEIKVQQN